MEKKLELPPELPEDEEILAKELKEQEEAKAKKPYLPIQVRRLRKKLSPRTRKRHRLSLKLYFRSLDKNEPANKDFQIELLSSSPTDEDEENIRKMFDEEGKIRTPCADEIVPESWLKIQELMGERVAVGKNLRDSLKFLGVTRVEGEEEEEEERAARALFTKKGKEGGETVQPSAKLDKPGKCSKEMQKKSPMKKKKGGSGKKKKKKKSGKVMSKKQKKSLFKFLS